MFHEVLAALTGCPGSFLVLGDNGCNIEVLRGLDFLHPAEEAILTRLCALGSQFKAIQDFAESHLFDVKGTGAIRSLYARAFAYGLTEVLKPYRMDIWELELEILKDPHISLTHFLQLEKYAPLFQHLLDVINILETDKTHGCKILEVVFKASKCGVPMVEVCMQRILKICHRILLRQINHWMILGVLSDEFQEFFIHHVPGEAKENPNTNNVIKEKYVLESSLLPSYIPTEIAEKILFVGQSLKVLEPNKYSASRKQKSLSEFRKKEIEFTKELLALGDTENFSMFQFASVVNEIRSCAAEQMWKLIVEDSNLLFHFRVIRDFYLLGNGDLFMAFIEGANKFLKTPVITSTLRDARIAFQSAALGTCSDGDSIIENFQVVLQDKKNGPHGINLASLSKIQVETGWSTIALLYDVPSYLDIIFSPPLMTSYNNLFRFLLAVRRVQVELNQCFVIQMCNKSMQRNSSLSLFWQLRTHMAFFIDNLQYYLQVDVLESEFADLLQKVESEKDFETIQRAHEHFLFSLTSQCFLNLKSVYYCLLDTLELCSSFCELLIKLKNSVESNELALYSNYRLNFQRQTCLLFRILSGMRSHQASPHLAQFMLRMDYNKYVTLSGGHLGGPQMVSA